MGRLDGGGMSLKPSGQGERGDSDRGSDAKALEPLLLYERVNGLLADCEYFRDLCDREGAALTAEESGD